ncbi:hypothetical protein CLV55_1168 [Flavobacterium aciduliphilum]|uniref:Uncharacterized protein n=1 Tax=Flavobacterium aciduliphilum TaxID=1101402 RepID=A0A328Y8V8_9FLAO|nr:hypothetical protein CLV55_1168 [Flavobacterium aciduliphilum]
MFFKQNINTLKKMYIFAQIIIANELLLVSCIIKKNISL